MRWKQQLKEMTRQWTKLWITPHLKNQWHERNCQLVYYQSIWRLKVEAAFVEESALDGSLASDTV